MDKAEVVVAIVQRADGRVLMIRRRKSQGALRWAFPGGKIEAPELEGLASQREVKEEAGIDCVAVRKLGQWQHPDTDKNISYWLCRHKGGRARVTEPEVIDKVGWFTPQQVREKVTSRLFPPLAEVLGLHNEHGMAAS